MQDSEAARTGKAAAETSGASGGGGSGGEPHGADAAHDNASITKVTNHANKQTAQLLDVTGLALAKAEAETSGASGGGGSGAEAHGADAALGCTGAPWYQDEVGGSKARKQLRRLERLVPQWAAELAVPLCTDKTKPASERIFGGDAESGERLYRSLVEPAVGLLEWCAVLRAL